MWMYLQQTTFWKHCDKIRNCSKRAISPFITMFSTLLNNYGLIYRKLPDFFRYVFEGVCCIFAVCWNWLIDPFPPADAFWRICSRRLRTHGDKRELLMSNDSFLSHSFQLYSTITPSFIKSRCVYLCLNVFKLSSAADMFYVGKGLRNQFCFLFNSIKPLTDR